MAGPDSADAPQGIDNVWTIYSKIIDETCRRARHLQNDAVLQLVKERWLTLLRDRIIGQREKLKEETTTRPLTGHMAKRGATTLTGVGPDHYSPNKRAILETGVAPRPEKFDSDLASSGLVEDVPRIGIRPSPTPAEEQHAKETWEAIQTIDAPTPAPLSADIGDKSSEQKGEDADAEEDDWGEWEDPDRVTEVPPVPEETEKEAAATQAEQEEPANLEGTKQGNEYLPRDEDFAARLTTQYGRGNWDGNAWGEDPDEVNSDMENIEELSDEEPVARDVLVGQFEEVSKPPGRKPQTTGLWRIRARDGIAKINGHEIFFSKLTAELEFTGVRTYEAFMGR